MEEESKLENAPAPVSEQARALEEIERTLDRMLILAELSASDADVDRAVLQRTLERLREKIDRIADGLEGQPPIFP